MKDTIKRVCSWLRMGKILGRQNGYIGSVLTFHRIGKIDPYGVRDNEHLKVSEDFLNALLKSLKSKGFSFVSLDELLEVHGRSDTQKGELIHVTLDDGYRDNLLSGLPIFKSHSVPITIFASTGFMDRDILCWWDEIAQIIAEVSQLELGDGTILKCETVREKNEAFAAIRTRAMSFENSSLRENIIDFVPPLIGRTQNYLDRVALNWDELKCMATDPLVTVGCHSHSHLVMRSASKPEILADLLYSRERFNSNGFKKIEHFCFPFGGADAIDPQHIKLIHELGFKSAVTTRAGNIYKKSNLRDMGIPRLFVSELSECSPIHTLDWYRMRAI